MAANQPTGTVGYVQHSPAISCGNYSVGTTLGGFQRPLEDVQVVLRTEMNSYPCVIYLNIGERPQSQRSWSGP